MNLNELARRHAITLRRLVKNRTGKVHAKAALRATFQLIAEAVQHGERIHIPGFGVFDQRSRKSHRVSNPVTSEAMQTHAFKTIGFRPAKVHKWKEK